MTFLLVALLQNTQKRADDAVQHKLNAIAQALSNLMGNLSDERPGLGHDRDELRQRSGSKIGNAHEHRGLLLARTLRRATTQVSDPMTQGLDRTGRAQGRAPPGPHVPHRDASASRASSRDVQDRTPIVVPRRSPLSGSSPASAGASGASGAGHRCGPAP